MTVTYQRTLLFISDSSSEAKLCELILQQERQDTVIHAPCQFERIAQAVTKCMPDIIFLDHGHTDGADRMSLYHAIRTIASVQDTPIIFWRTDSLATRETEAKNLGISGYISVVCQPFHLIEARDAASRREYYYPPVRLERDKKETHSEK